MPRPLKRPRRPIAYAPLVEAVQAALAQLRGTYGLAMVFRDWPDVIVAARLGSPLVIGVGDGEHFIASDGSPLVGHTDRIVYLADNEIGRGHRPTRSASSIATKGTCDHNVKQLEIDTTQVELGDYPHYMLKEIFEQPETVHGRDARPAQPRRGDGRVRRAESHAAAIAVDRPDRAHRLRHELALGPGRRVHDRGVRPDSGRSGIRQRAALSQSADVAATRCCSRSRKAARRSTRWPPCAK